MSFVTSGAPDRALPGPAVWERVRGDVASALVRLAGPLLLALGVWIALPAAGVRAETRVHGIEADATGSEDRLLVLGDGELAWRIERDDPRTTQLVLRDARLDPSVPRRVSGRPGSVWSLATVTERTEGLPEVRISLRHAPGAVGRVTRREDQLIYSFDRRRAPPVARRPDPGRLAPPPPEASLRIRQLNGDVRDLVVRLARFVGMELFFDESLTGRVSIDAPQPVSREEALGLIDALLLLKGFAALPTPGGVYKIVPIPGAQGAFVSELPDDPDEVPLTTLVLLSEIDAGLVEQAIRPLIGQSGVVIPHPSANGLILAGPGHRLRRLVEIIRELDELGPRRLVILNLVHADALTTASALEQALEPRHLEVWPDPRSNRLLVRGRPDRVEAARAFVARIDRPAIGHGAIQVLPMQFGNPERAAEILNALRGGADGARTPALSRGAGSLAGREFIVSVHTPTRSLVVQADPETMELVREVLAEIDQEPARIEVDITVAEVSTDHSLAIGFDAIVPIVEPRKLSDLLVAVLANPSASVLDTNPLLAPPEAALFATITGRPLVIPVVDAAGNIVNVTIPLDSNALTLDERTLRSQVLLRPHLSLLAGESHEIFAGDNVPIRVADSAATSGGLQTRQNIERHDVGVSLRVEPTVGADDGVVLALALEVSRLSDSLSQDAAVVGPTIRERTLESTIRLRSGHSAVIGIALTPIQARVESGTPFLKDIPILGWLFRSMRRVEMDNHLLVIARAEVHRPGAEALSEWMGRRLAERPELAGTRTLD